MSQLQRDVEILENKLRFVLAVINDEIVMKRIKKRDLVDKLLSMDFTPFSKITQIQSTKKKGLKTDEEAQEE